MKQTNRTILPYFLLATMLILVFDSKTALAGAVSGIDICLHTVIPTLFPLMVLSILFTNFMLGKKGGILNPIGKICGIPSGAESILLTGLLGGYPLGAVAVANAYNSGHISHRDANRMLSFCSNCGPAFIFGMGSVLFPTKWTPLILWLIHILSALITGAVLPCKRSHPVKLPENETPTLSETITMAIRSIGTICSWIILFKTILSFCQNWFLWLFPSTAQVLICGLLELTNGFVSLLMVQNESTRFLLASIFLSFGGLCVSMQTASQIGKLKFRYYLFGKTIQTCITIILTVFVLILQGYFRDNAPLYTFAAVFSCLFLLFLLFFSKKDLDFSKRTVYNDFIKPIAR